MDQKEFITNLLQQNKDAVVISSLGTISYDMKDIEHPEKIIIKGAMGSALGCGLGYALGTAKQVIVLIGDGSFLMKMGSMSTILKQNLPNLRVIVLNNQLYKSCGNQGTNFNEIKKMIPFEVYDVE